MKVYQMTMQGHSLGFIVGVVLLLTNQVVGWAGLIAGSYFARKTKEKKYYLIGKIIYAISWGMVFAGIYLAGPEGVKLVKDLFKAYTYQAIGVLAVIAAFAAGYYFYGVRRKK